MDEMRRRLAIGIPLVAVAYGSFVKDGVAQVVRPLSAPAREAYSHPELNFATKRYEIEMAVEEFGNEATTIDEFGAGPIDFRFRIPFLFDFHLDGEIADGNLHLQLTRRNWYLFSKKKRLITATVADDGMCHDLTIAKVNRHWEPKAVTLTGHGKFAGDNPYVEMRTPPDDPEEFYKFRIDGSYVLSPGADPKLVLDITKYRRDESSENIITLDAIVRPVG